MSVGMTFRFAAAPSTHYATSEPIITDQRASEPHSLTHNSVNASWPVISSAPPSMRHLSPLEYSRVLESSFSSALAVKRHAAMLNTASTSARLDPPPLWPASSQLAATQASYPPFARPIPDARTSRRDMNEKKHAPFAQVPLPVPRPRLVSPTRNVQFPQPASRSRKEYGYAPTGMMMPNPALPLPNGAQGTMLAFNHGQPATYGQFPANPQVAAGFYSTHYDDPHFNNPYQSFAVELLDPASTSLSPSNPNNPSPRRRPYGSTGDVRDETRAAPASLGFGGTHRDHFKYIHATDASSSDNGGIDANGDRPHALTRANPSASSRAGEIVLPLAPHLTASLGASSNVSVSVPYSLARFIPTDPRDGAGQHGHANAAGLGFGTSHRNYNKYISDNREGREDVAEFRANHRS